MNEKKTFVFNTMWREVLRDYPAEVRLEVYEAIMDYVALGILPDLKPLSNMAFKFIKNEIDYNAERYNEIIAKKREAGKAGGLAKQANVANVANANSAKHNVANVANVANANSAKHNDNVNVNDNVNDIENIEGDSKGEDKPPMRTPVKRFIVPTLEQVAEYCKERNSSVNPESFISYYSANGWKVGKNPMKDWKAAVRNWENNGYDNNKQSAPANPNKAQYRNPQAVYSSESDI